MCALPTEQSLYCRMNKAELAEKLAEKVGIAKGQAEDALNALTGIITETLKKGDEVVLTGFGSFSSKKRAARVGVNPQHPEQKIQIPAVTVPKFKAGKALKDALK
ncbi:MAG: Histone-like protein [Parcubacteria group bacterium GW2011_GWA2_43_13]|nr:MAG: Histone-like protein [Parcubacteria group bacterium GW2011_GWA2_43_13]